MKIMMLVFALAVAVLAIVPADAQNFNLKPGDKIFDALIGLTPAKGAYFRGRCESADGRLSKLLASILMFNAAGKPQGMAVIYVENNSPALVSLSEEGGGLVIYIDDDDNEFITRVLSGNADKRTPCQLLGYDKIAEQK